MHATAYPTPRVVHGKSVQRIRAEEVLVLPLVQAGQDLHQIVGRARFLAAVTGGVVVSVEVPHGVAPILEQMHPTHNACGHDSDHG